MGRLLHRVGSATAGRPLVTVLVWVLVLASAAGAFAVLQKPLSTRFEVPDSEFSRVIEELGEKIPAVAGGVGTVVLRSDRPFTAEQRQAVTRTIEDWQRIDHVTGAIDPFATQRQADDAARQLREGRAQLRSGQTRLDDGRTRLLQGQGLRDAGRQQLERARAAGAPDLATLQRNQAALEEQVRDGERRLAEGQAQLDAGAARVTVGEGLVRLAGDTRFVSADGRTAVVQLQFDAQTNELPQEPLEAVQATGAQLERAGLQVEFGQDISYSTEVGGITEVVGVGVAAVILLVMLGSALLAGIPLMVALVGVGTAISIALSLGHWTDVQQFAPVLGLMLGLAVGIDYALFIVNRHRINLAALTAARSEPPTRAELRDSIARATATAGVAVTVAGLTVFFALAGLVVTRITALSQMGLVGAATVALTVVVALTLTPALLSLAGTRAVPKRKRDNGSGATPGAGWPERWHDLVVRRPGVTVLAVIVLLVVVALPALSLRLGLPDGGQDPPDTTSYRAYTLIEETFGPGTNGPVLAVAELEQAVPEAGVQRTQLDIGQVLGQQYGVRAVLPVGVSEDRRTLAFQVIPDAGPSAERTVEMVGLLRGDVREELANSGVRLGITGATAANIEVSGKLAAALPLYVLLVIGMSLLLLTVVFRSLVVPVLATGGYLLSVAAAFGAVVAVYQWGWLGTVFGVHRPGAVVSFLPIVLIGIVFGLAMDYQMFLVSGMREARLRGVEARRSVRIGFVAGARVVTAAALIMVSVFAGFIAAPMTMARPIGLGLGVGVLADAFLVRMVLTPAAMAMLGDRAWYLPRWLDRLLPHVDVEGGEHDEHEPVPRPAPEPAPRLTPVPRRDAREPAEQR